MSVPAEGGVEAAAEASVDGDAATKRFCPVAGALFCSDFEAGTHPGVAPHRDADEIPDARAAVGCARSRSARAARRDDRYAGRQPCGRRDTREAVSARPGRPLRARPSCRPAERRTVDRDRIAGDDGRRVDHCVRHRDRRQRLLLQRVREGRGGGADEYNESPIGTIDAKWHRFEVECVYTRRDRGRGPCRHRDGHRASQDHGDPDRRADPRRRAERGRERDPQRHRRHRVLDRQRHVHPALKTRHRPSQGGTGRPSDFQDLIGEIALEDVGARGEEVEVRLAIGARAHAQVGEEHVSEDPGGLLRGAPTPPSGRPSTRPPRTPADGPRTGPGSARGPRWPAREA